MRRFSVICARCGAEASMEEEHDPDPKYKLRLYTPKGWELFSGKDICPDCVKTILNPVPASRFVDGPQTYRDQAKLQTSRLYTQRVALPFAVCLTVVAALILVISMVL